MDRTRIEAEALAEHRSVFGEYKNYTPPRYEDYSNEAIHIPMSEGHRIALDVTLPAPLPPGAKLPTILYTTRYWRAKKDYPVDDQDLFFTSHGYAFVRADERGTGASFGTWPNMWPRAAIADYRETVDWIVAQPWSNGAVGSTGVSYTGTTAQLLAATNHPAVKAGAPKFIEFDVYTDIFYPGGLLLDQLMERYIERCRILDLNRWTNSILGKPTDTVKPVDADLDGSILAAAVEEHRATNPDFSKSLEITFRDDPITGLGVTIDDFSMHGLKEEIERSGTAIYGLGELERRLHRGHGDQKVYDLLQPVARRHRGVEPRRGQERQPVPARLLADSAQPHGPVAGGPPFLRLPPEGRRHRGDGGAARNVRHDGRADLESHLDLADRGGHRPTLAHERGRDPHHRASGAGRRLGPLRRGLLGDNGRRRTLAHRVPGDRRHLRRQGKARRATAHLHVGAPDGRTSRLPATRRSPST